MSTKKKMNIEEFVEFGYLQEVNRLVLNPVGLALEVRNGKLDGIWDKRSKREGLLLSEVDPKKAARVSAERRKRRAVRSLLLECDNETQRVR